MINTIFNAVGSSARYVRDRTADLFRAFALASCPPAERPALDLCYKNIDLFKQRVIDIAKEKGDKLWDIAEVLEVADYEDSLNIFAALFLDEPGPGEDFPVDPQAQKYAQEYLNAFQKLSLLNQERLLRSLMGYRSTMLSHVDKAIEEIEDEEDRLFDSQNPPRP